MRKPFFWSFEFFSSASFPVKKVSLSNSIAAKLTWFIGHIKTTGFTALRKNEISFFYLPPADCHLKVVIDLIARACRLLRTAFLLAAVIKETLFFEKKIWAFRSRSNSAEE
jgi:hypothetical protein